MYDDRTNLVVAASGKSFFWTRTMKEHDSIPSLIDALSQLRADMLREEESLRDQIEEICEVHREGARNLAHYIALRRHDIRELQEQLAALGLSSLGRIESDVLGAVDAVLGILRLLAGEPRSPLPIMRLPHGWDVLERNTDALLGPQPSERNVRIMITMPSEATTDFELVRDLLLSGMNCMRINCAHDGPEQWAAMIANLKKAMLESGRECRVHMDLGGPKLRTGSMQPGPAVLKCRPKRDAWGRTISPARILLTPDDAPQIPSASIDKRVPVARSWLASLNCGDRVTFKDARGASRSMRIVETDGDNRWAEIDSTAYLIPGTVLRAVYGKSSPRESETRVCDFPALPQSITLRRGDTLLMLRSAQPGEPAVRDQEGHLLRPGMIGVAQPEFLDHVRAGEKVKLDDGKIGGIIRSVDSEKVSVEIVQARTKGSTLRAEKGINLPESELKVSPLTADDIEALPFVAKHADIIGYSFVRTPENVRDLQARLKDLGADEAGIDLKIENRQAFEQLPSLLLAAMRSPRVGVMIARGDLAVECGYQRLAEVQEQILWLCEAAHIPVIWATQVLDSLAKKGVPSRPEITDAAAGVRAECVMLNKGPFMVKAVRTLDDILMRMEEHQQKGRSRSRKLRLAEKFPRQE